MWLMRRADNLDTFMWLFCENPVSLYFMEISDLPGSTEDSSTFFKVTYSDEHMYWISIVESGMKIEIL
jgi:hypothetical protein